MDAKVTQTYVTERGPCPPFHFLSASIIIPNLPISCVMILRALYKAEKDDTWLSLMNIYLRKRQRPYIKQWKINVHFCVSILGLQVALVVKSLPVSSGDLRDTSSIPGSGRSPGGGNGSSLQYSCVENPMDRGAW